MNSISPASKSSFTPGSQVSSRDKEIQGLMQQKVRLNEEVQAVKSNDELDTKTKAARIKSLTSSITQIDTQIAQIKAEEMEEKNKLKQPEKTKEQQPQRNDEAQPPSMDHLIMHSQTYDQLGKLVGLRDRMNSSIQTIEGETKFDRLVLEINAGAGKSMMLENAERTVFQKKREIVQNISSQMSKVGQKIGELMKEIHQPEPKESVSSPTPSSSVEKENQEVVEGNKAENKSKISNATQNDKDPGKVQDTQSNASPAPSYTSLDIRV
ncbi:MULTISPECIES: FlxA-like family protein [unclassified Paenibacillus]|uniref:FlxA-like family protein n=1 Tax=unclassified Paenibacillus TaxID=185978 RepID=UPI0009A86665|nr:MULTISPECIES: FlxA-like family protein [unclassified Paenibacillus]SLJ91788.1 FlxA-like protein [Paenibacillus sp. RU5A]SOC58740.1 FlxA-like protein [Paenibacillus sp. RU26A]SOC67792.1 FlxA-like protein [Paenibacillus sp. RU5M]